MAMAVVLLMLSVSSASDASSAAESDVPTAGPHVNPSRLRVSTASDQQRQEIGSFFRELDADHDGQIETHELSQYLGQSVGGKDLDTEREIRDAAVGVTKAMDGQDIGSTISEDELLDHLTAKSNQLLSPHRVERWVQYGLGFPQYAKAFESNAITALDFTALIADNGASLREDLGVTSGLHHGKLMRALKRQILGLGSLPSEPRDIRADVINGTAIAVQWSPPEDLGTPPVHAYVVQMREGGNPTWEMVGHVTADEHSFVSRVTPVVWDGSKEGEKGKARLTVPYQYRVVAWGAHGCSGYSKDSAAVELRAAIGSSGAGSKPENVVTQDNEGEGASGLYSLVASSFLVAGLIARFLFSSASFIGGPGAATAILWKGFTVAVDRMRGRSGSKSDLEKDESSQELRGSVYGGDGDSAGNGIAEENDTATDEVGAYRGAPGPRDHRMSSAGNGSSVVTAVGGAELGYGTASGRPPLHRTLPHSKSWVVNDAIAAAVAAGVASADESSPVREKLPRGSSFISHTSNGSGSSLDDQGFDALVNSNGLTGGVCAPMVGSEAKKKGRCCAIGCEARWDRWTSMGDIRMKYTKHYCGLCQRAYCQAHTRISPHGAKGRCDPESKCYCATCYATLPTATQEALEASNKLPSPKLGGAGEGTPKRKAKTLWRSLKNYKLRTASSASPASMTPSNSSEKLSEAK